MYTLNEKNAVLHPSPTTSETQHDSHLQIISIVSLFHYEQLDILSPSSPGLLMIDFIYFINFISGSLILDHVADALKA